MEITNMKTGIRYLDNASCRIKICMGVPNQLRAKCRELSHLDVPPNLRRKGMAEALLRNVIEEADAHNMLLVIFPEPFGEEPKMTRNQLASFYERFGFQTIQVKPKVMMARMPHSTPGNFKPNYVGLAITGK